MMSHLPHVVIVAIMAAIMQVTIAAPNIDLNAIDSAKFGVKKEMDLLDRQEFWHGLENVTIKFGFHKDAKMVWETVQNHTTMLAEVMKRLNATKQADEENSCSCSDDLAKLNTSINANQAASDGADSNHTQEIEALEKLLRQANESFIKKLEDLKSNISDLIQQKTDDLEASIEKTCDGKGDTNENGSATSNMIITIQKHLDNLEKKVSELVKDKTDIASKLDNLERTMANVTYTLNTRHVCPSGYDYVKQHDRCLMFVKTEVSFENAEDECQKHFSRGHLAVVDSKAISDYLEEQRKTDKTDKKHAEPWIALHYNTKEKAWHWENAGLDFSENSWTNWDAGQPKLEDKNCVLLSAPSAGKWRTESCSRKHSAWCQATPAHVDTLVKQEKTIKTSKPTNKPRGDLRRMNVKGTLHSVGT